MVRVEKYSFKFILNRKEIERGGNMKELALLLILILAVIACATGEKISNLREGMSRQEVTNILGNPDGFQRRDGYEVLRYTNRVISGWDTRNKADYSVILKDGKVVEYGAGEVRVNPSNNVLFLVPLR